MATETTETPWYKKKPILLIVAGGVLALTYGYMTAKPGNNAHTAGALEKDSAQPGLEKVTPGAGMGSAGQTAEFNQTFASRLREEQATSAQKLETAIQERLKQELRLETDRLNTDAQRRDADVNRRLDDLIGAQNAAQRAAEARQAADSNKSFGFKMPKGGAQSLDATGSNLSAASPARQGLQKTADLASTANYQPVIPPNGFVSGRLLNGVVATVGEAPTAFLVALEGTYKAANGYTVNLNGCVASVEAKPNLAAGRIEGKPAQITCNFADEGRVQTWDVAGWIVDDEDGIRGLHSVIVDNSGKKITANALAGALAAAGNVLSMSQFTTLQNPSGTSSSLTGSPSQAMLGNAVAGAGTGLQQALNEHYALYKPSLQKGGNAKVTLVIVSELAVPAEGSYITTNVNAVEPVKK